MKSTPPSQEPEKKPEPEKKSIAGPPPDSTAEPPKKSFHERFFGELTDEFVANLNQQTKKEASRKKKR